MEDELGSLLRPQYIHDMMICILQLQISSISDGASDVARDTYLRMFMIPT